MTSRANITPGDRAFFFSTSGNDLFDGASVERALKTPQVAINKAALLNPSIFNPAFVSGEKGTYTGDITLSDGIVFESPGSTFVGNLTTSGDTVINIVRLTGSINDTGNLTGSIGRQIQIIDSISSNATLDQNHFYRIIGGSTFTLPPASAVFNRFVPFKLFIHNDTAADITLNTDGSDILETHQGDVSSILIARGSTFFIICDATDSFQIVSSYGLTREEVVLNAFSFIDQNPSGTDNPLQINFGAAQLGPSDPVQIDASGAIEINRSGQYNFAVTIQYGRIGAGSFSLLFFRFLVDGVQFGSSRSAKMDNSNANFPVQFSVPLDLVAGQVITMDITRDSSGFDSGSLLTETAILGVINPTPSASITITRYKVV